MSNRDRRIILWLCCAAICWRWILGMRAPLPGVDACSDLWLAAQLAEGNWAALGANWSQPLQALLLAPAIALGASPFSAAQVLACICAGIAIVPTALAAERLREGSGVPAAVLAMAFAGTSLAAGAGAATPLRCLLLGCGLLALVSRRWLVGALLVAVAAAGGVDRVAASYSWSTDELRVGVGASVLLLPALLAQRSKAVWVAYFVLLFLALGARAGGVLASLMPIYSPLLAVVAGIAIVPVPVRVRDLILCAVVLIDGHAAWTLSEARAAVVERVLPQFLIRRVHEPGEVVVSSLPRVRWAAGLEPKTTVSVYEQSKGDAGSVVLDRFERRNPTLRASLRDRFEEAELPYDLREFVDAHDLMVLQRRRK